jgi:hypothetical protein
VSETAIRAFAARQFPVENSKLPVRKADADVLDTTTGVRNRNSGFRKTAIRV